jgi:hypothetical protein
VKGLTKAQIAMLRFYESRGPTSQSDAPGTLNTWRSLVRLGLLTHSHGLGAIETEITPAGLQALKDGAEPKPSSRGRNAG